MKLYYSPGACSLAVHIAFEAAGVPYELIGVDLKSKKTQYGADFLTINPKGYVPALVLDDGEMLTENLAVLDWFATQAPALGLDGPLGRTRLIEALAFIATEVHKGFKPFFAHGSEEEMERARAAVGQRLALLADRAAGPYLFGMRFTVADCYLFVMLLWAERFGITVPDKLLTLRRSMASEPAVRKAMDYEGLRMPGAV